MANGITCVRILCALSMVFFPTFSGWFYLLYALGCISDVLDGMLARRLGSCSGFGARLDTLADIVFTLVVLSKVMLSVFLPLWLLVWVAGIIVLKLAGIAAGFVKYHRFLSEHTVLNKICGILLFAIPPCIGFFPWQPVMLLILATCMISTAAAIQEGYLMVSGKEVD